jgi:hypothetical protein
MCPGGMANMNLGVLTEQTCYNARLQPVEIRYGPGTTTNCQNSTNNADTLNLAYTYNTTEHTDNNGNVLSQAIVRSGTTWNQSYTYDSLNRLYTAGEGGNWSQTYLYDGYGNRAVTSGSTISNTWATATSQFTNNRMYMAARRRSR